MRYKEETVTNWTETANPQLLDMAEIDRFRIRDALFIIGSIITFIADQATGGLSSRSYVISREII